MLAFLVFIHFVLAFHLVIWNLQARGFILFGMAKTFQYGGLTILGVEGVKRLKKIFHK